MSKYSKKALDAAEDAVVEAGCHHLTNRAMANAVFDSLERAPWWEEVQPGYAFQTGEPYRSESPDGGIASEYAATHTFTVLPVLKNTYFRDTRWQPPVKPLKVGDLIDAEEQAVSLPVGTIVVTQSNVAFRKAGMNEWQQVNEERGFLLADFEMAGQGDRITYLPRGDFNE